MKLEIEDAYEVMNIVQFFARNPDRVVVRDVGLCYSRILVKNLRKKT